MRSTMFAHMARLNALRTGWLAAALLVFGPAVSAAAGRGDLAAMAAAIGSAEARAAIEGIATTADGTGPRGPFTTEVTAWRDSVGFVQSRADARSALLLDGDRPFALDETSGRFVGADQSVAAFVRGHAVHAFLLRLDARTVEPQAAGTDGCVATGGPDGPVTVCRGADSARPVRMELRAEGAAGPQAITIELGDWREVHGVWLPYLVDYLEGGRRFAHRFTAILPFRIAPGLSIEGAADARFARLADIARIARLHFDALEAHRAGDVERLVRGETERATVVRRGELVETSKAAVRERIASYFGATRFTRYDDVAVPVVALSADGTLGWLACQIEAAGTATDAAGVTRPLAYGFSWVELVAKTSEGWQRIGNASSPRP